MATPKSPFAASLAIHIGFALLLFTAVTVHIQQPPVSKKLATFVDLASYRRSLEAPSRDIGGGGGGARSPLPVSQGQAPKRSSHPFAPPMIRELRETPLLVEPALLNEPALMTANFTQWGDPLARAGPPSNGPGSDGGMGSGDGGGLGPGYGPRSGPGSGPGGSPLSSRSRITAPRVIYQVDPEFSEEARRAKYNGTVVLLVDVDTTGHASNIRIAQSVGLGLDEKAVEAVSRWRFLPGRRDGTPVTLPARIEVNFHLL